MKDYVQALIRGSPTIYWMVIIVGLLLLSKLGGHLACFLIYEQSIVLRKGLTGLLYDKSLRLSMASIVEATPGKLINLCSADLAFIES